MVLAVVVVYVVKKKLEGIEGADDKRTMVFFPSKLSVFVCPLHRLLSKYQKGKEAKSKRGVDVSQYGGEGSRNPISSRRR